MGIVDRTRPPAILAAVVFSRIQREPMPKNKSKQTAKGKGGSPAAGSSNAPAQGKGKNCPACPDGKMQTTENAVVCDSCGYHDTEATASLQQK